MTEELLPCPWCKNHVFVDITDEEGNYPKDPGYEKDPYSGLCYVLVHPYDLNFNCPIAHYKGEHLGLIFDTREEAISRWNARTEPPGIPEWLKEKVSDKIKSHRNILNGDRISGSLEHDLLTETMVLEWVLSLKPVKNK